MSILSSEEKKLRDQMEEAEMLKERLMTEKATLSAAGDTTATTMFHRFKTRPFVITGGTIGGEKNSLSWSTLSFKIKQGFSEGYSENEVMVEVINAIDGKCPLKEYLEGSVEELSWEEFQDTLKQCLDGDAKDSQALMDEMVGYKQGVNQDFMEYTVRMMDYRKKILKVSLEEECPLGEAVIQKRFVNSVLLGVRNPTTRLELQPILKDPNLNDKMLRTAVREIRTRDKAIELKFEEETTKKASAKSMRVTEEKEDRVLVEINKISARINEMNASRDTEIATLQKQMDKFQKQLNLTTQNISRDRNNTDGNDGDGDRVSRRNDNGNKRGRHRFIKCEGCEASGAFCTHCWKCGSGEHKKQDCPSLNE